MSWGGCVKPGAPRLGTPVLSLRVRKVPWELQPGRQTEGARRGGAPGVLGRDGQARLRDGPSTTTSLHSGATCPACVRPLSWGSSWPATPHPACISAVSPPWSSVTWEGKPGGPAWVRGPPQGHWAVARVLGSQLSTGPGRRGSQKEVAPHLGWTAVLTRGAGPAWLLTRALSQPILTHQPWKA